MDLDFSDVAGAEFLSFRWHVAEGEGGNEGAGEAIAPNRLLVPPDSCAKTRRAVVCCLG